MLGCGHRAARKVAGSLPCFFQTGRDISRQARDNLERQLEMVPGAIKKMKKEWLEERVATLVWMVREGHLRR